MVPFNSLNSLHDFNKHESEWGAKENISEEPLPKNVFLPRKAFTFHCWPEHLRGYLRYCLHHPARYQSDEVKNGLWLPKKASNDELTLEAGKAWSLRPSVKESKEIFLKSQFSHKLTSSGIYQIKSPLINLSGLSWCLPTYSLYCLSRSILSLATHSFLNWCSSLPKL